ncbi:MAG: hypothetical protein AB7O92_28080 [Acidimicrobiia bacterium]
MREHRRRALPVLLSALLTIMALAPGSAGLAGTVDGAASATGPLGAGATMALTVAGRGGIPATGVAAVALNVTATNATEPTFLTVHPSGSVRPDASNLNVGPGETVANLVISNVGADGAVVLFNDRGRVDVVVDVAGWFDAGSGFTALQPARVLDSRKDGHTLDGSAIGFGPMPPRSTVTFPVLNRAGVPSSGVGSVVLSVTAVGASEDSFLNVYPAGHPRPASSNVNVSAGGTAANLVLVPVGEGGNLSIHNALGSVELLVDVLGWFPTAGAFVGVDAARLADTRPRPTVDGMLSGAGGGSGLPAGATLRIPVLGRAAVPGTGVAAVALNVTAVGASAPTYLSVWPAGAARPEASNVNVAALGTRANVVIVPVGTDGSVELFNAAGVTGVAVDVLGWFPAGAGYQGVLPARLLDTRPT